MFETILWLIIGIVGLVVTGVCAYYMGVQKGRADRG